jgi:hypothetical protein
MLNRALFQSAVGRAVPDFSIDRIIVAASEVKQAT